MPFDNDILNLVFRWIHIIPATFLVGGLAFLRFVIIPTYDASEEEENERVLQRRRNWAKLVMACSGFLIISGLYNTARVSINYDLPSTYHMLLGIKILMGMGVFFLASALSGRTDLAKKLRKSEKKWLSVALVLAVALILIAGYMGSLDHKPKSKEVEGTPTKQAS